MAQASEPVLAAPAECGTGRAVKQIVQEAEVELAAPSAGEARRAMVDLVQVAEPVLAALHECEAVWGVGRLTQNAVRAVLAVVGMALDAGERAVPSEQLSVHQRPYPTLSWGGGAFAP